MSRARRFIYRPRAARILGRTRVRRVAPALIRRLDDSSFDAQGAAGPRPERVRDNTAEALPASFTPVRPPRAAASR